jgi:hypothetical protein
MSFTHTIVMFQAPLQYSTTSPGITATQGKIFPFNWQSLLLFTILKTQRTVPGAAMILALA